MNKKYLLTGLISLFAITLVVAAYIVSSFVITVDIMEPFEVKYAIIDADETCMDVDDDSWVAQADDSNLPLAMFTGESERVCAKINNAGTGDVSFTFSGNVLDTISCANAFENPNPSVSGVAAGGIETRKGFVISINDDADDALEDCKIAIELSRG